jgi:hypothetical protein
MANFLMRTFGSQQPTPSEPALALFERLWHEFDTIFNAVIIDDQRVLKKALKGHKTLLQTP